MKLSFTLNKWLSDALSTSVFTATINSLEDMHKLKQASLKNPGLFWVSLALEHQHLLNDLIRENFEWIDTYLEFSQKKSLAEYQKDKQITCRFAENTDQKTILTVGKNAFKTATFYNGLQQNKKLSQKLKKSWLQHFFQSRQGDALVVAEYGKSLVGFLQLSKKQNQWHIDILAVTEKAQKKGIAKNLLIFANQQFGLVSTSTNLANMKAIQFYEDCFFQLKKTHHVLLYSNS